MPIRKRPGGKYQVWIEQGGQRSYETITGTAKDAKDAVARLRLKLKLTQESQLLAKTFSSFCLNEYTKHCETELKQSTWDDVRRYQIGKLVEYFQHKRLDTFSTMDVEEMKRAFLKDRGRAGVNEYVKVLSTIFRHAKRVGENCSEPDFRMLKHKPKQGKVKVWTQNEVTAIYKALQTHAPEVLPIFVFLINTGCRKGEALALCWKCVDKKQGMIFIEPSEEWQPKNGEARMVPISTALRPWLEDNGTPWVFPNSNGGRWQYWPRVKWDLAIEKSKVAGTPHTARHTFASHFLAGNPDMFLLAKLLGHSHARVTKLYAHLLPDHLDRARDVVSIGVPLATVPKKIVAETVAGI